MKVCEIEGFNINSEQSLLREYMRETQALLPPHSSLIDCC